MLKVHHFRILSVFSTIVVLSACAQFTHLTRNLDAQEEGGLVLIDAKQRAILTSKAKLNRDGHPYVPAFCAEPSPDALSAVTASLGGDLTTSEDVKAVLRGALSEQAAPIGLRTQSIQLMRDAMFRICELAISGKIGGPAAETLHRRFQQSMVAILAIEQITGPVRPPAVALTTKSYSGAAEDLAKITDQSTLARTNLAQAESDLAAAKAEQAKHKANLECLKLQPGTAAGQRKGCDSKISEADRTAEKQSALKERADKQVAEKTTLRDQRKKNADIIENTRKALVDGNVLAGGTAQIESVDRWTADPEAIEKVAKAVERIVEKTFSLQFSNELCTTALLKNAGKSIEYSAVAPGKKSLRYECLLLMAETKKRLAAETKLLGVWAEVIAKNKTNPDILKKMLENTKLMEGISSNRALLNVRPEVSVPK